METNPLIIKRIYNAPIEKVWDALTNKDQMKKWYFDVPDFKPETGCKFHFNAGGNGKTFLHLCEVTAVTPLERISYTWKYDNVPGESEVTFELSKQDKHTTLLTLTHTGLHSFPQNKDFQATNFVKGWTYFTEEALPNFLK